MQKLQYIEDFEKLGYGLFVHYGLFSILARGEWARSAKDVSAEKYEKLIEKFNPKKNWAKELVKTAKACGCKYITLTTRHHDGFSLFDTCGLNEFDAPHSKCKRDLIREFVDECNAQGVIPFFYHTLLDWHNKDYVNDFPKYIDYLIKSVEILCRNYGKIGGLWFDGMWNRPNDDWQEDRLYGTIRKYQPDAMIINNTGITNCGKVWHPEIDSVTFERGQPCFIENPDKYRAGEMCQILNDHWGYTKNDCNYKSVKELIENLVDCRSCNCNFLLNIGPKANGEINPIDKGIFECIAKWIKVNKNFIYDIKSTNDIKCENATMVKDSKNNYYAIIKNVGMAADPNVALNQDLPSCTFDVKIKKAVWLDNNKKIKINDNSFKIEPFEYGNSYTVRVAKINI